MGNKRPDIHDQEPVDWTAKFNDGIDPYEVDIRDGKVTVYSECCADVMGEETQRALYEQLKAIYEQLKAIYDD